MELGVNGQSRQRVLGGEHGVVDGRAVAPEVGDSGSDADGQGALALEVATPRLEPGPRVRLQRRGQLHLRRQRRRRLS